MVDGVKLGTSSGGLVGDDVEKLAKLKNELLDKFNEVLDEIEDPQIIDETQVPNRTNNLQQQNEHQQMRVNETQLQHTVNNSTMNVSVNDLSSMLRKIIQEEVKNTNNSNTTEITTN